MNAGDHNTMDVPEIIAALKSGDLARQGPAAREAAEIVKALTSECINAFLSASYRGPIADGLQQFGVVMQPLLTELLIEPLDDEAKNTAAALLFAVGSEAGLPYLLSDLNRFGPADVVGQSRPFILAAVVLGKAGVAEAAGPVERALRGWDVRSDPYMAATLIDVLNKLGGVPDDLRRKLEADWPVEMRPGLPALFAQKR
jgi:hypothetical protein